MCWSEYNPAQLSEGVSLQEMASLITKRTRTAADGDLHDATLAMDLDGTRHPLKREQSPEESRSKIPSEYVYRCRHRQNNSLLYNYSGLKSTRRRTIV